MNLPSTPSFISVGDLDIPGNKLTVEALYFETAFVGGTPLWGADIVSKHNTPSDVNYLLRQLNGSITTTNGFFETPYVCEPQLNKLYHVAMVYDGSTLKFYRNGFLMSQVVASGNLYQNDWQTQIGLYAPQVVNENFIGYINEVRIWNVARTQAQIKTYMNSSLPNPASQTGLLAYYTFDNLLNKQGNAAWNGTLNGSAAINAAVPNCNFIADSCKVPVTFCSGTVNTIWKDDFGSGTDQISTIPNPNITSGYVFQEGGVHPGNYGMTNHLNYFSSWHDVTQDHTPNDNNGYFLIIDGNNAEPIFYRVTLNNICPFTQYSFSTAVMNIDLPNFPSDQTFTFIVSDLSGNQVATWSSPPIGVTTTPQWQELGFSFNSGNNTTLKFEVKFNQTGFDDFAFDDLKFSVCGPTLNITGSGNNSCNGNVQLTSTLGSGYINPIYQWQKKNAAGIFVDITGANSANYNDPSPLDSNSYALKVGDGGLSCPIIDSQTVIVQRIKKVTINKTICTGSSFEGHNQSGSYVETFNGSNGCDSIRTLNLTVSQCGTGKSTIVNDYTPVISFDPCNNGLIVDNAAAFKVGDTVLIIQMKGAFIDSSNTASFGTITNYRNAGNYEFNYIKGKNGNDVYLKNILNRQYDIPDGKVQLIKVPYYQNLTVTDTLTCLPWDGRKGGVLVVNVQNDLTLNANMDVSGRGFRGGQEQNNNTVNVNCGQTNYYFALGSYLSGAKGEGIAETSLDKQAGRGKLANGGGGGNDHNSGGGGGANSTAGGTGGDEFNFCAGGAIKNGGVAGQALPNYISTNKIYLGGGGGSGHANDPDPQPFTSGGGNGGGIIMISANKLISNNYIFQSNGKNGTECTGSNCNDGAGGGGAAGSILLNINSYVDNVTINANGGNGANTGPMPTFITGPGGGGSGGVVWFSQNTKPVNSTISLNGGVNGVNTTSSNDPWGSQKGSNGQIFSSLILPIATKPFIRDLDSVKINYSLTTCQSFSFTPTGYPNSNAITSWLWDFNDGSQSTTKNTAHTYLSTGAYNVKLSVTSTTGCTVKDSVTLNIKSFPISVSNDTAICRNNSVQLNAAGAGNLSYSWAPGTGLSSSVIANPVATPLSTTKYQVQVTDATGCVTKDSVLITVNSLPVVKISNDTSICVNATAQLTATGGSKYTWTPSIGLSSNNIANPLASPTTTTKYIATVSDDNNCFAKDSVLITVQPLPLVTLTKDTATCLGKPVQLIATGGANYSWAPSAGLNNAGIANPIANPSTATNYTVIVTGSNTCKSTASVMVNVKTPTLFTITPDTSVCAGSIVQLNATGGDKYSWTPVNLVSNTSINNPTTSPSSTTVYTVNISEPVCKTSGTLSTRITVLLRPVVAATKSNDISCSKSTATLSAAGALQYTWTPATSLVNANTATPVASPVANTTYIVTGTDTNQCTNTATVTVLVNFSGQSFFFMPNSFTPNSDGHNDCFRLKYYGPVSSFQLSIFNRLGERVFNSSNPADCWDGNYKGQKAAMGNYVYHLKANTACGSVDKKGNLLLIR